MQSVDDAPSLIEPAQFEAAYGEKLDTTLDIGTWSIGGDLQGLYQRIENEVSQAVRTENELRDGIRREVIPKLLQRRPVRDSGLYQATLSDIEKLHCKMLFNGAVEACDGTSVEHDTLPLTITQLGVCLTSYQGDTGSWVQRLYRRDLRATTSNVLEDVLTLLHNRRQRGSTDVDERNQLSNMARRGIMLYAERAILTEKGRAPWRMGHGPWAPYELLTGSGNMQLLERSLSVLETLALQQRKFVFVPSAPSDRLLLTVGHALHPLEYLIIEDDTVRMGDITKGHYEKSYRERAMAFAQEVGKHVVIGVYRASHSSPPYLFYSHIDFAHEAAHIALADSVLQEHRGFPLLIDIADRVCQTTFGNDIFGSAVQMAYSHAGEPTRYLTERQTRK